MTDDLDDLFRLLRKAPPPDAAARAEAMALAMQNFDRLHQGTAGAARPTATGRGGLRIGVTRMIERMTSRGMMTATASVAALGLGLVMVLPDLRAVQGRLGEAPVAVPAAVEATPTRPAARPQVPAPALPGEPGTLAANQPAEVQAGKPADAVASAAAEAVPERAEEAVPSGQVADMLVRQAEADDGRAAVTGAAPLARKRAVTEGEALADTAPPAPAAPMTAPVGEGLMPGGALDYAAVPQATVAPETKAMPVPDTEDFPEFDANPVKVTAEAPVSTFSIDVDTASYAVVRSSLNAGVLPDPQSVRIEEMVNYFPYDLPAPAVDDAAPFRPTVTVMETPWNPGTRLVQIAIQGRKPAVADRPPLNLVFLVDTSGSMDEPQKLPLLKQSLALILPQLRDGDQVAMVAYAGSAGTVLEPVAGTDRAAIMGALDRLAAGGSTAGAEGLELAYRVAERMAGEGEVSRILLATDGDFNVGVSDPDGLEAYVARKRATGTYLSILGFGRGNLDDAVMQALAQAGNGTAAYIDTAQEARKVLVDQLQGALFPIADDVKIQVEWNPATVAEYRLIGYETRALAREDFNNDRVDAGEIGAGHAVTAVYEITAPDSPARAVDDLRYGQAAAGDPSGELGFLRLRWKAPGAADSALLELPVTPVMAPVGPEARFAAAVAGFGQLLTGATYLGDWGWDEAIALALEGRGEDPFGYRAEAVNLMRLAQALSQR
jgi:Ca-activated chloride channel family protein